MTHHLTGTLELEIIDDPNYVLNSDTNGNQYDNVYIAEGAEKYQGSTIGIKLFDNKRLIRSCAVFASAGATVVTESSFIIEENCLLICCANQIFSISIHELSLNWNTEVDWATAFKIFPYKTDYIVHCEMQIVRINKAGEIIWTFGGADIFVNIEGENEFKMEDEFIDLLDFAGQKYRIDYNGKEL